MKFAVLFGCALAMIAHLPPGNAQAKNPELQKLLSATATVEGIDAKVEKSSRKKKPSKATVAHFALMTPSKATLDMQKKAKVLLEASKNGATGDLGIEALRILSSPTCPLETQMQCDSNAMYRTIDGTCNNLAYADWGSAPINYRRVLAPKYQDGLNTPRYMSMSGGPLPSAREVSLKMHPVKTAADRGHSLLMVQWGQFLAHDILLTPSASGPDGNPLDCSACDAAESLSEDCFPIPIPSGDPLHTPGKCMAFTRALAGQMNYGYRQQLNQVTAFIDASLIYGSDDETANNLRKHMYGYMKVQDNGLPPKIEDFPFCNPDAVAAGHNCFEAGDFRNSFTLGLASLHAMFLHEHNDIAKGLAQVNPMWDDEKLYQEARRIVAAQNQHITFNQYLTNILGEKMMRRYRLLPTSDRRTPRSVYDPTCNAGIWGDLAAATFRYGHTQVSDDQKINIDGQQIVNLPLAGSLFDPNPLYENDEGLKTTSRVLVGIGQQKAEQADRFSAGDVSQFMLASERGAADGIDLFAFDVQRGRDFGLQPYVYYRKALGLSVPRSWRQLRKIVRDRATFSALRSTYKSIKDIDLFTGALSERFVEGGRVGTTSATMIARQFKALKTCDRFYYEDLYQPHSFTRAQLNDIKKTTSLEKLICRHIQRRPDTDAQKMLQAFGCSSRSLRSLDFNLFKDNGGNCSRPSRRGFCKRSPKLEVKQVKPRCPMAHLLGR